MNYAFFVHLNVLPAWLRLPREERACLSKVAFACVIDDPELKFSYYDAEAFTGDCTDIALFQTGNIQAYYFAIEALKDTELFSKPYFEIVRIIPAIENGYQQFESHAQQKTSDLIDLEKRMT